MPSPNQIMMLDVDNTLYPEKYLGIEAQIVRKIYDFVASSNDSFISDECMLRQEHALNGTIRAVDDSRSSNIHEASTFADGLHRQFGSTVEGLRQTLWKNLSHTQLRDRQRAFYDSVYTGIDYSSLLNNFPSVSRHRENERSVDDTTMKKSSSGTKTGYSHDGNGHSLATILQQQQHVVRSILSRSNNDKYEWHVASNSPLQHIQKVIQAMGLTQVPWTNIWTPDYPPHDKNQKSTATTTRATTYPTKLKPREFWGLTFLKQHNDATVTLVDDSVATLAACRQETNFQTVHLQSDGGGFPSTLPQVLGVAMGWLLPASSEYEFSDIAYLRAKNIVDRTSMHTETWMQMISELTRNLLLQEHPNHAATTTRTLTIVEIGAGLLSMLTLVLAGSDHDDDGNNHYSRHRLPSLLGTLQENGVDLSEVHYYAYEPNQGLEPACVDVLESLGFTLQSSEQHSHGKEAVFVRPVGNISSCTVYLRFWDYREQSQLNNSQQQQQEPDPHLIIGCCFADLLQPHDLVTSLIRCFLSSTTTTAKGDRSTKQCLVYLPITFGGITQFLPPQPFENSPNVDDSTRVIPSDTKAFELYAKALTQAHGHNLDPHLIELAMADYGAICLGRGRSNWVIDPRKHDYLWRTMLYFFGSVAAPEIQAEGWNACAWLDRARKQQPKIDVTNIDLLFQVPRLGEWDIIAGTKHWSPASEPKMETYDEILFTGPRQVTTLRKDAVLELRPNEIRIQTECSLISSGTELKVFKGNFDDASLDVNIKGMDKERMAYPLAYGYSLVGRVVECGFGVEHPQALLGKRVFTFSAHASQVVTERSAVQLVPDDIAALDAIFMPSVETALSLIQDARPIFGEKIAIFGQGLIGLLVTALLCQHQGHSSGRFGTVSTFDTFPDRLAASAAMGASQALHPTESHRSGPFDLAIEVSGNSRALQSAIDYTRNGGRIVLGSWYGNEDILLKLGMDFHRSHKTIKASQVSEIPADLCKTWTKERRFALSWELVKCLRPSRLITRRVSLECAQDAYHALEKGDEIAVAFDYR